ncbi:SGNH/GDSL hydrolase family protein [Acetanaerobacterium elongatum]|uniref:Lysophospholipase L1 n=1 Tax=Acetanaerobacterium elongatum TaxID=258515 RepID=A0A1H0FK38_9FIRM|nr:SGNH/GDSL hydrolase family protein [Acetanaerobacterium elongatum]SDN94996.1 Lysophospholipase L1 [Acetanaerobacterium elongatum]
MNIVKQVQIYGDSIMKGILLDAQSKKYYPMAENTAELFKEDFSVEINNRSKFGCTIQKGHEQLKKSLDKGLACDMVLLEYGGNDSDYNWEEVSAAPEAKHQPHTPIKLFESIYRSMILELKEHNIIPLVMSLPPIDGEKYLKWITRNGLSEQNILRFLGDVQMIYRFQELYSLTATRIAYECGAMFVDVRSAFLDKHNYKELICEDGIHPNKTGHQLIQQTLISFAEGHLKNPMQIYA